MSKALVGSARFLRNAAGWIVALLLIAAVAAAVVALPWFVAFRTFVAVEYRVLETAISPDGKVIAVVYERHGNATEPLFRFMALHPAGDEFDPSSASPVFQAHGTFKMRPVWKDAATLVAHYPANAGQVLAEQPENRIRIEYVVE
ncbi:MAG TPA: hypothetical protein VED40_20095 [Azospirillaceae bacterium]|nr:hypothetical protein [Azospirillaceae bacterium]